MPRCATEGGLKRSFRQCNGALPSRAGKPSRTSRCIVPSEGVSSPDNFSLIPALKKSPQGGEQRSGETRSHRAEGPPLEWCRLACASSLLRFLFIEPAAAGEKTTEASPLCEMTRPRAAIGIHDVPEVGKEVRRSLDFVENGTVRKPAEKPPRVGKCKPQFIRVFQGDIGFLREDRPGKGGLPRLPGPGNCHDRETPSQGPEGSFGCSPDHRTKMERIVQIVNSIRRFHEAGGPPHQSCPPASSRSPSQR